MRPPFTVFVMSDGRGAPVDQYSIVADGRIEPIEADHPRDPSHTISGGNPADEIQEQDGSVRVVGQVGGGWGDAYKVHGNITEASLDGSNTYFVLNGQRVGQSELVNRTQPEAPTPSPPDPSVIPPQAKAVGAGIGAAYLLKKLLL